MVENSVNSESQVESHRAAVDFKANHLIVNSYYSLPSTPTKILK